MLLEFILLLILLFGAWFTFSDKQKISKIPTDTKRHQEPGENTLWRWLIHPDDC